MGARPCAVQLRQMFGGPSRQNAAVDRRMQRLDPSAQYLREAGHVADIDDIQPGGTQRLGGAAAGDQVPAQRAQPAGEFFQPSLVGNADQRSMVGHRSLSLPSDASSPPSP